MVTFKLRPADRKFEIYLILKKGIEPLFCRYE